jgi:hypothetical protein
MSSTAGTEYIAENLQTVSFIEAVCRRPKMYTLDGTLAEVFCFLNGFYSSIANHNPPACETASHNWDGFLEWASARLAGCPTSNWADVAAALRRSYPEESVVLMLDHSERRVSEPPSQRRPHRAAVAGKRTPRSPTILQSKRSSCADDNNCFGRCRRPARSDRRGRDCECLESQPNPVVAVAAAGRVRRDQAAGRVRAVSGTGAARADPTW